MTIFEGLFFNLVDDFYFIEFDLADLTFAIDFISSYLFLISDFF